MHTHLLAVLLMLAIAGASAGTPLDAARGAKYGAKIIKADTTSGSETPKVRVLTNPDQWQILTDEASTGINSHEFYFTLSAKEQLPPPEVEIVWPGVQIARVLGADGTAALTDSGVRFKLKKSRAPTSVHTTLQYGIINMAIFHNWDVRRAGHYRNGKWPATQIQAQLNFLFAAREMCRAMGFADTTDPGFVGDIRLYGFETNYPNGHDDYPPHFHIMLAWPGWTNTQAAHFRLNEEGQILTNELLADDGKKVSRHDFAAGEVCQMRDKNGKVGFELIISEAGRGVIMRRAAGQAEFLISPAGNSTAVEAVQVSRREHAPEDWLPVCTVSAIDDAALGQMKITLKRPAEPQQTEMIRYDRDTGFLMK